MVIHYTSIFINSILLKKKDFSYTATSDGTKNMLFCTDSIQDESCLEEEEEEEEEEETQTEKDF